jgi:serine/threonine protein kinase
MDTSQAKILIDSVMNRRVGGWMIDGSFGNGKSAVVLSAIKNGVGAAIKIFHPELIERYGKAVQLERIGREKQLIGAIHPHLVKILDGGECAETGHLFIVMERVPYKNMQEARAIIPPEKYGKLISQIASAARFLEDRGLAHRDIKPENIAVTDDFERAILLDLGVLLPIGLSDLTDVNQRPFIGTLRYSSPEFLDRTEEDTILGWRAVTFYQMGAVLHDLVMQKALFEEASEPFSRLVDAVHRTNPPISGGDAKLMHLARRALAKTWTTRLDLLEWRDFESAGKETSPSGAEVRKAILERQKLSRANLHTRTLAEAEVRRLFVQRMDQISRRLDTRLASVLASLDCFPLRSTNAYVGTDDTRRLVLKFNPDAGRGMPNYLALSFTMSEIDFNEGAPLYAMRYQDVMSSSDIDARSVSGGDDIFKGLEEDLFSSPLLEETLMGSLTKYYDLIESGKVKDGEVIALSTGGNV